MSLYKHCDAPDCNTHAKVADWALMAGDGWIKVNDGDLHFCSWACIRSYAERKIVTRQVSA
jgi:hypothetical protein